MGSNNIFEKLEIADNLEIPL